MTAYFREESGEGMRWIQKGWERTVPRVAFTAKTRKYLGSLDAVESVTQYRIRYSKEFRDDCMRRYAEGGSPAAIFREAGLDPKIIGYKRVERCIARWKAENAEKAAQEQEAQE